MPRFLQRSAVGAALLLTLAGAAVLSRTSSAPAAAAAGTSAPAVAVETGPLNRPVYGNRDLVTQTEVPAPTPVPTPAPAPITAPRPAPRPVATPRPAVPAPAAPVNHHDWLQSADGSLHTGVTFYSDCTGVTPIPQNNAAIDTCWKDVTYFVGHNYGVFTPLLSFSVGTLITYWDSAGTAHPYRVVEVRDWTRAQPPAPPATPSVVAQFQTCLTVDGSQMRILDVVPA